MAAEFGQLETCGILLELGADMRSVDNVIIVENFFIIIILNL